MADPVTAGIVGGGMLTTLVGGIIGAQGASMQAKAQQTMYNYQSGMAELNAKIAKQNADWASRQGETEALRYGISAGQRFGQIRASQAASGLDVNTGSAKAVQTSQQAITRLDLSQIRQNAAKTAYDYDVQSTQYQQQAALYTYAGANAAAAGQINVEASLLGTASSVSSEWLKASQTGVFSGAGSAIGGLFSGFTG